MFESVVITNKKTDKSAKVMAPMEMIDDLAYSQVEELLGLDSLKDAHLVFQSDIHGGKGCTIGTTIKFNSLKEAQINPQWVGNDISCGLTSVKIGRVEEVPMDFDKLDELSQTLNEPAGLSRVKNKGFSTNLWKKIGRVSSGNHFMSVDVMDGYYWITVHNGSLSLGQDVYKRWVELSENKKTDTYDIIESLKEQDKAKYIQPVLEMLRELDKQESDGTLRGIADLEDYLRDIELCEQYAFENRLIVIQRVLGAIYDINTYDEWEVKDGQLTLLRNILGEQYRDSNLKDLKIMNSPHNYVKLRDNGEVVVHKGACSAEKDEDVLIPINMRDGIIVGKGKGNPEWNYAAPHGAGRMYSRTQARKNIELDTYLEQTKDVRSISINEKTLDEAPDAYKPMDYILEQIQDTVEVTGIMRPVYNFKVAEDEPHWVKAKRLKKESNNL